MTIPTTEFPYTEERIWDLLSTESSGTPIQRRLRQPDRLRRWELRWRNATVTDKNAIVTEFRGAMGNAGTFSWTPVEEVSPVTVRFVAGSLRWRQVQPRRYEVQVQLEEVLLGTTT